MRIFDLKGEVLGLSDPDLESSLGAIKGLAERTAEVGALEDVESLKRIAVRKGVVSSCAIGNVFISDLQEKSLFEKGKEPTNFETHMVKGYLNALNYVNAAPKDQPLSMDFLMNIHYEMYKEYNPEIGGKIKNTQNYIQKLDRDGLYNAVYVPAAPEVAYSLLDNLLYQYELCEKDEEVDKLKLIAVFMLDFLCIHPFNHGNGRMSRLILHFLLNKYGYEVDSYFPISSLLDREVGVYLDAFKESAVGWGSGENDYLPYAKFLTGRILEAYRKLGYIMGIGKLKGSIEDKVFRIISDSRTPIDRSIIENVLYATSPESIDEALENLMDTNKIRLLARGTSVKYTLR